MGVKLKGHSISSPLRSDRRKKEMPLTVTPASTTGPFSVFDAPLLLLLLVHFLVGSSMILLSHGAVWLLGSLKAIYGQEFGDQTNQTYLMLRWVKSPNLDSHEETNLGQIPGYRTFLQKNEQANKTPEQSTSPLGLC